MINVGKIMSKRSELLQTLRLKRTIKRYDEQIKFYNLDEMDKILAQTTETTQIN